MPGCHICGKKFYACSNCHLSNDWEYHFCSIEHWRESKEYKEAKTAFLKVKALLPPETLDEFLDRIMGNCDYDQELENWKKE